MRILLLLVLLGTVGVGLYDFLIAPSRESAMQIIVPTAEKMERSQAVIEPVATFVASQTPDSVVAMARQAGQEIQASLEDGAPISSLEARVRMPPLRDLPAGSSVREEPAGPPGLDWYRGKTSTDD